MDQLMNKLIKAKAVMDASEKIKRGDARNINNNFVENFQAPPAKYNIPGNILESSQSPVETKPSSHSTFDSIQKSKLPDAIKKLMIEHPISQPSQPQMSISNELIERASRLMKKEDNNYIPESAKPKNEPIQNNGFDYSVIKKMVNEAVREALKENGMITENTEKSNEFFSFKVGKHIFEGKVTKIKKLS